MKRFLLSCLVVVCFAGAAVCQESPVHWQYSLKKLDQNIYEVHLVAKVDAGWHIYSQKQPKEAVASPTLIMFTKNPLVHLNGKTREVGKLEKYEIKSAGIINHQYADQVDFVQDLVYTAKAKTNITGKVAFQACTDSRCLPEKTEDFSISIP
jgi:thiol:disulfide interchange protein DsbD